MSTIEKDLDRVELAMHSNQETMDERHQAYAALERVRDALAARGEAPAPKSHGLVLQADTYVPANPATGDRARIVATVAAPVATPSELESAHAFLRRGEGMGRLALLEAIEARDAAMFAAGVASVDVKEAERRGYERALGDTEQEVSRYYEHARGTTESVLAALRSKLAKGGEGE